MIAPLRPQTDARSVVEPEPAALGLSRGDLQPLPSPDALDPFLVHRPARGPQQRRDPAIAVTAILLGQRDDVGGQCRFVIRPGRGLSLGGAMLAEDDAGATLGYTEPFPHRLYACPATSGA